MKKVLIVLAIAVVSILKVSAINPTEYSVFYKLNDKSTFSSLSRYLGADYDQSAQLKLIFSMTEKKMNVAIKNENNEAAEKAMYFNLANARHILSAEQYKKYLIALNISRNNLIVNDYVAEK